MLRKSNTKLLIIILLGLGIIYALRKITEPSEVGNLPAYLANFTPADCQTITITGGKEQAAGIILQRKSDGWMAKDAATQKEYKADSNRINQLLKTFSDLKPLRLATQNQERWNNFDVTDSSATRITFSGENGPLAGLMLGRFTYTQSPMAAQMQQRNPYMRQNPGTMSTYIRKEDEKEVYAVEGFLSSLASTDVSAYRDRSFLALKGNINPVKLNFSYPADSSFVLRKKEGTWWIDNRQADSASVAQYFKGLRNLQLRSFAKGAPQVQTHQLTIAGNNGMTINVNAGLNHGKKVLKSDQYPDNPAIDSDKYLFNKIFWPKQKFLKH